MSSLLTTACSMLKAYWSCGGRERACCKVCQGLKPRCHLRVLAGQRCNSGLGLQSKRTNSKVSYALRALHNDLRPAGYALVMSPWQRVPSFGCAITQAFCADSAINKRVTADAGVWCTDQAICVRPVSSIHSRTYTRSIKAQT